jgi:choline dehydrogenase-like flavoprotein
MVNVFPATHNMGTARMGSDRKTSVCNRWGQTHDVDNLFVSDGSLFTSAGCENPTLTIVALALRQADHIAGRVGRGEL